jgi:hypothetical protein
MLVACGGCRQVFGVEEVAPIRGDASMTARDGSFFPPFDAGPKLPGLRMHALAGTALWMGSNTSWTQTLNHPGAVEDVWLGTGPDLGQLAHEGVDPNGVFSVWMEGEVYVDGTQQLQFTARDYAFFAVDLFGTGTTYLDFASSMNGVTDMASAPVGTPNWYPVRIGWTSSGGTPSLDVLHKGTTDTNPLHFNTSNLRH